MAKLETPQGLIHARSPEDAAACADALGSLAPEIERILQQRNDRVPLVRFRLAPPEDGLFGGTGPREIVVYDVDDWRRVLAHELVHWNMTGHWKTLPTGIEEGMAHLIGAQVRGADAVRIPLPTTEAIELALVISDPRMLELEGPESARIRTAGAWVFASVGLDEMRRLAREAQRLELDPVPPEWIRPFLDERVELRVPLRGD